MTDRSTVREGGFTLVEIVIAVAIVAATVAAGLGISLGSRSLAVSTAAGEFDQFLDSARTIARELDGATLAFTRDAYGDGTEVRLLAAGPNGPPTPTTLPNLHARATIEEAESLGKAPFAFIVHANGSLSGRRGYRVGDATANDVGCPASGAFHFVIKAAGGSADRFVPCRVQLAANGPVTLAKWPGAPIAPSPTPCSGVGCTSSLPGVPTSTPSCPPTFTAIAGGCAPPPSLSTGARYHVTITGAPATINVGATGSLTAQATLTNANAVPAGTPVSIPVGIQTADTTCAATPSGWQPSGSAFTVTGTAAGACTLMAQADVSAVPGAATDAATVSITIAAAVSPMPTPTPSQCDLVTNGKCYHRIVDQTAQTFYKYVFPDSQCDEKACSYLDSIKQIVLEPTYAVLPSVTPRSPDHELLFKINAIRSVTKECEPFSAFASMSGLAPIPWSGSIIGGPAIAPLGFGEPAAYATVNHFSLGVTATGSFLDSTNPWSSATTLQDMYQAVAFRVVGSPFTSTYSSENATGTSYVQWYPDFPGCDAAGDISSFGREYGIAGAELEFEIYQAEP